MKDLIRQILSVGLAMLVLLSTVSWTVEKHLCMGRVMDISLFAEAEHCAMEMAMAAMGDETEENHCCDDESFTVSGQDDLKLTLTDLELEQQVFLVAFTHGYLNLFESLEELPVPHEGYPPPLITRDIHLLDQVFLI
ncbi:HYC_CC_PP family protein [Flagellimonas algicola]|uniref:HYC_CC_PP family protein n=1 Tax=Flagellimonas algicola TaxID=2583815 RepID=UPI001F431AA3|nr:hypothetical protein [Allomuricauda algicola]